MIAPEGRAELRRLLVGAMPQPWRVGMDNEIHGPGTLTVLTADLSEDGDYGPTAVLWLGDADAALIVALRNNAEALLDTADKCDMWREQAELQHNKAMGLEYDAENGVGLLQQAQLRAEQAEAERDRLRTENDDLATIAATLKAENDRLGRELKARGRGDLIRKTGGEQ